MAPNYSTDSKEQINHFKEVVMHAEMIRNLQVWSLSSLKVSWQVFRKT